MIGVNRRLLFIAAAMLVVVSLSVVREPPKAAPKPVPEPLADAPPYVQENEPIKVGWHILASLDYRTGKPGKELAALDGKLVKVPGFAVPLEDWASSVTEFLLVPYVGACIHTPPPPPNQLIYIEMEKDKWAFLNGWNPVWVEGVITIELTKSVYGYVGFTITGKRVYPYEY